MAKKTSPTRSRGKRRQPGWSRRRALKALAAVAVAAKGASLDGAVAAPATSLRVLGGGHDHPETPAGKAGAYRPLFFTPHEFATITAVTGRIIPSDSTPGAREARVSEYVDWMVGEDAKLQPVHREGLRSLDGVARKKYGATYARLSPARQDAILRLLDSAKESSAENGAGVRFWKSIRRLTVDGFYSSKAGLKELGYSGNTFLLEFKGCTHPEHKA